MQPAPVIVPYVEGRADEAARLVDTDAVPAGSVLEPVAALEPGAFRDAVVSAALEREGVAGVLFAARWAGGAAAGWCLPDWAAGRPRARSSQPSPPAAPEVKP